MNRLLFWCAISGAVCFYAIACNTGATCGTLAGRWTNREGQELVFQPGGKALWLVKFGSTYDTSHFNYQLDCTREPAAVDFSDFDTGPMTGKTLFGILEWSSDSSFRLNYEAGTQATNRPTGFDAEHTQQFFPVK